MKSMIKASLFTALLALASCAHYPGYHENCGNSKDGQCQCQSQCKNKSQCPTKSQCPMHTDESKETAPAKK